MKNKKIIISGPPSSGKSSIINKLIQIGEICCSEVGPIDIKNKTIKNSKIQLSEFIFKHRQNQYNEPHLNTCFYDRSMIDVIAYLIYWNIDYPSIWDKIVKEKRYNEKVFYTPIWNKIYQNSNARPESYTESCNIDTILRQTYIKYNYKLIEVPKLNIQERTEFIINRI